VYKGRKKIRIELILVVVILKEIDKVINTLTWIANHPSGWEWSKLINENIIPKLLKIKEEINSGRQRNFSSNCSNG
jgi:hypothetical protein